jgi:hypothetical protein
LFAAPRYTIVGSLRFGRLKTKKKIKKTARMVTHVTPLIVNTSVSSMSGDYETEPIIFSNYSIKQ